MHLIVYLFCGAFKKASIAFNLISYFYFVTITQDVSKVFVASVDRTAKMWDLNTDSLIQVVFLFPSSN